MNKKLFFQKLQEYFIFIGLLVFIGSCAAPQAKSGRNDVKEIIANTSKEIINISRENADNQLNKPYVILVSIDGYRYDYTQKFHPPNLSKIAKNGVSTEMMIPSYPSKTFANHYSIVTGLYPQNHGIIHNYFYDPIKKEEYSPKNKAKVKDGSWYGGTPLWVLAEQNQMLSASYFWIGSEAKIKNIRPTYYYRYNKKTPYPERVDKVLEWLKLPEKVRPHFMTLYFSSVDTQGHRYGTESEEVQEAVLYVDEMIGKLQKGIDKLDLPINLIVVSDHGMQNFDKEKPILWKDLADYSDFKTVFGSGTQLFIYGDSKEKNDQLYQELLSKKDDRFEVFRKGKIPKELHFDNKNRVSDIVLSANSPYVFGNGDGVYGTGTHGFNPYETKSMGAIFYAEGSAFKENYKIKAFQNTNVYPLIAKILDLEITEPIDGKLEVLEGILKENKKQ